MNFKDGGDSVLQLFDQLRSKASKENFYKRSSLRDDKPAESTDATAAYCIFYLLFEFE